MLPVSVLSSSTKEPPDNRYNPTHAIDGDLNSLYFTPVFDSSITDKQPFWVKVRFNGAYYIRYVKHKVREHSFFLHQNWSDCSIYCCLEKLFCWLVS